MAVIAAAVIAGAAGIYGGMQANKASARQSAAQMDFQERMSTSAHQREVGDLRAAGLNPILSGTGGRGASSPAGAQAPQRNVMEGVPSTALAAVKAKQEIKNMKSTQRLTDFAARKTQLEGFNAALSYDLIDQQSGRAAAEAEIARRNLGMTNMDYELRELNLKGDKDAARFWSSDIYGVKRRTDAGLETARKLIPFTSPGGKHNQGGQGIRLRRR